MYISRLLSKEDLLEICSFPQSTAELFFVSPRFRYPLTPDQILELLTNRFEPMIYKVKENYGIKKLLLSCHHTNSRGLAFYNKHQFKPYDMKVIRLEDGDKMITIQMERELN